ncbi:hypothetical protein [Paenibacillus hemerocallicola]|uniref:hypothetical protein n=1 Tax=Paenibacillus hemerocallicola TaxID=1172614 RepID=UPI00159ED416|nr:hypothetical protein [Paenibacillus hemerocallicola]
MDTYNHEDWQPIRTDIPLQDASQFFLREDGFGWVLLNGRIKMTICSLHNFTIVFRYINSDRNPRSDRGVIASDLRRITPRLPAVVRLTENNTLIRMYQDEGFGWVIKFVDPFGNELGAYEPKE